MTKEKVLYLDLLKRVLTYSLWGTQCYKIDDIGYNIFQNLEMVKEANNIINQLGQNLKLTLNVPINGSQIMEGEGWPAQAHTMVGMKRLQNVQDCLIDTIINNVEGDVIETGVWRGGTCIFMKGILEVFGIKDKKVWVADSFEGIPAPNIEKYPEDKDEQMHLADFLRVSLEEVRKNFEKFGLLDDQVVFLKGWFKDTLPKALINKISVLRLDGDTYESTINSLEYLYYKVSNGGFIIIDDFHGEGCRMAVLDFREKNNVTDEIITIDKMGVYWKKQNV